MTDREWTALRLRVERIEAFLRHPFFAKSAAMPPMPDHFDVDRRTATERAYAWQWELEGPR